MYNIYFCNSIILIFFEIINNNKLKTNFNNENLIMKKIQFWRNFYARTLRAVQK